MTWKDNRIALVHNKFCNFKEYPQVKIPGDGLIPDKMINEIGIASIKANAIVFNILNLDNF